MSKEQIIDEAYENYLENCLDIKWMKENFFYDGSSNHHVYRIIKESFIRKCKTDSDFSEKWGLKIEERELSVIERIVIAETNTEVIPGFDSHFDTDEDVHKVLDTWEVPTKLITITYKNETIESYE